MPRPNARPVMRLIANTEVSAVWVAIQMAKKLPSAAMAATRNGKPEETSEPKTNSNSTMTIGTATDSARARSLEIDELIV